MPYAPKPGRPTPRQQRFIDAYLRTNDAPSAARAAGYGPSTVRRNAAKLLKIPSVAAVLRAELDARAERTRIAADRIVLELARVAFSDMSRIADWDNPDGKVTMRPPGELSDADRAAIARVTRHGGHLNIELHDKIRALDALGKYFKLWGKHADKFAPRAFGEGGARGRGGDTPSGDYSNAMQARARAFFQQRIRQVVTEDKLREEAEWAKAWRERFGA
jgi:phage terminase small subunit